MYRRTIRQGECLPRRGSHGGDVTPCLLQSTDAAGDRMRPRSVCRPGLAAATSLRPDARREKTWGLPASDAL
jgi:hypothetical protein